MLVRLEDLNSLNGHLPNQLYFFNNETANKKYRYRSAGLAFLGAFA